MKFPHIAIIGGMGAGKSTVLGQLSLIFHYKRMSWATPVKEIAAMAYGQIGKDQNYETRSPSGEIVTKTGRTILQQIGTDALRNVVDNDFWVKAGVRAIDDCTIPGVRWANDDTRFKNEAKALRERGFVFIRLVVPDSVRRDRLGLTAAQHQAAMSHPSEHGLDDFHEDIAMDGQQPPGFIASEIIDIFHEMLSTV